MRTSRKNRSLLRRIIPAVAVLALLFSGCGRDEETAPPPAAPPPAPAAPAE